MAVPSTGFSAEQRQVLARIEADYAAWIAAEHALMALPYGVKWKRIGGREYLYEMSDRRGNGRSLGRRSPDTETRFEAVQAQKAAAVAARDASAARLAETARTYRGQRLPLISSEAARLLREADRRGLLGPQLLVVSDTAIAALELEAEGGLTLEREDLHQLELLALAPSGAQAVAAAQALLRALGWEPGAPRGPAVSARNSSGYEVVLTAPASAGKARGWSAGLEEADLAWLAAGRAIARVLVGRDGTVARVFTVEPVRLALLRLWRAERGRQGARERAGDLRTAGGLLEAFPVDAAAEAGLPRGLAALYAGWRERGIEDAAGPAGAAEPASRGRSRRLSATDRQSSIIEAAVAVFAEHGYAAATTQQIAAAANVSSGLLYRHFPSKRALYRAMLRNLIREQNRNHEQITGPEPSAGGIIAMLDDFMRQNVGLVPDPRDLPSRRVLFASLAGDGTYAQLVFRRALRLRRHVLERALAAARASGDLSGPGLEPANAFFFIDHIGETLGIAYRTRGQSLIPYEGGPEVLVRDAVRFCARGLGIAEDAVEAYYVGRGAD
jgi:AcrR family transcriptional regulator